MDALSEIFGYDLIKLDVHSYKPEIVIQRITGTSWEDLLHLAEDIEICRFLPFFSDRTKYMQS